MVFRKRKQSIGQIVDEVADKYFQSGMDAFTAQVMALDSVRSVLIQSSEEICKLFRRSYKPFESPSEEVPGDA